MLFKTIIELCNQRGFIKTLCGHYLKFGPVGALLQENLKTEWFYSMVINRDNSVFFSNDSFVETFDYAKNVCSNKVPFGIAEVLVNEGPGKTSMCNLDSNKVYEFDDYFLDNFISLQTTMFINPTDSMQFFLQWPRLRRMWWRKISASPGRYFLTDIQNGDNDTQYVDIKAEYPWGKQLIERLILCKGDHQQLSSQQLEIEDGQCKIQAHFVTSNISLHTMVLNALCDAYDEPDFQNTPRPLMRFHRKLAPYKVSFAVTASQAASVDELGQLALYLCRQLRNDHVSSLLLPSALKSSLEAQWCQYDQLGVPYTVLLNAETLKNGIALLRSRDTTLKEQIHVTKLPTYVQQLFKNY